MSFQSEKFRPKGGSRVPTVSEISDLTESRVETVIALWNECLPDYEGLLNASVVNAPSDASSAFPGITETSDWEWDVETGEYTNTDTEDVLDDDSLWALRDDYTDCMIELASEIGDRLTAKEITLAAFNREMDDLLLNLHAGGYLLGRGGVHAIQSGDSDTVTDTVNDQLTFWQKFLTAIAGGLLTVNVILDRLKQYIESVTQSYEKGRAANFGLQLPAYPGDGSTICLSRCRCHWRIEQTDTHWECYWVIKGPDGRNCQTCLDRYGDWNPWRQEKRE